MEDITFRRESAVEYFKQLVDDAIARHRLVSGELTAFYIVQLLAGFVRQPKSDRVGEPLGVRLAQALECGGSEQRVLLKRIGDMSLFVSGFFADSLHRRFVDLDYYVQIGEVAYNVLSRRESDTFSSVFTELGGRFVEFVDVLAEVSERTASTSNVDLLKLYERWLTTGSPRSGHLLADRGIIPNPSLRNLRVQ
jgi:hypothetical protein